MTNEGTISSRSDGALFFAFTGFLIAVLLTGVHFADTVPGAQPSDLYLIREYVALGIGAIGYVCFAILGDRARKKYLIPAWLYNSPIVLWSFACIWAGSYLVTSEHNRFIGLIAFIEALVLFSILRLRSRTDFIGILALCCLSWSLTVTLPFTPLKDWLIGASPGTSLSSISFVLAFFLALAALADSNSLRTAPNTRRRAAYFLAILIIASAAFRTDNFLSDWIPYHRAYFVDAANLVRHGHWLLWDVPSQYGFLSILAIAATPGRTVLQSLYLLTGILLTVQAAVIFTMMYVGRRGIADYLFAIALPVSAYFGEDLARYPFGARLYPQTGLRFLWVVLLIFVAFGMYHKRKDQNAVRLLRIAGFTIWALSLLWSFETGVWGTIVWLTQIGTETLVAVFKKRSPTLATIFRAFLVRLSPFVVLPILIIATLEVIYRFALGHGPDYTAYVEFSLIYAADPNFHILVDRHGPAWTIIIVLGALGTIGVVAARERHFESLPLIATAWMATWMSVSYWIGEAFNNHIAGIYVVVSATIAVTIYLSREAFSAAQAGQFARLSLAPIAIILIALPLGEPTRAMRIQTPLFSGSFDSTRNFKPVSGELAELVQRAKIAPTDPVVFPTSVGWIKLDLGFILPLARLPDGSVFEYTPWLPLSPEGAYNTIESLPSDRQQIYIDRNIDRFGGTGWLIVYREQGGCALVSPRLHTVRSVSSPNFTASLCALR